MKPITIIGGGLAGLTLGIALRRNGVPVTVIEAGHYPRHRVCGEFISGNGKEVLRTLDLEPDLRDKFYAAQDIAFFTAANIVAQRDLPRTAWCISRFVLDAALS